LVATALVAGVLLAQSWPAMFTKVYPVLISILILATSCGKDVAESNALNAVPIRSAFVVRVNNLAAMETSIKASVPGAALQQSFVFENLYSFARFLGE
jgi:hypothetical protein